MEAGETVRTQTAHTAAASGTHVVQFYDRDDDLARGVGDYLVRAVHDGAATIVIATPAHRELFAVELGAAGIDVTRARLEGKRIVGGLTRPERPGASRAGEVGSPTRTEVSSSSKTRWLAVRKLVSQVVSCARVERGE